MSEPRRSSTRPRSRPVGTLLLIGLIFHLVYIGSVFDCYFTSPVVHGMRRFRVEEAESKRLVLIVGDGLRADLLLNLNAFTTIPDSPRVVAPYLRSVIETRGAFGISHTRVPTESRPGHVALIGGMYEDVSAVTRGWKTNPVHFDSVFNQSSHTYSFGSPDILPMFAQGATPGKVDTWCYHEDEEDFTKDATALDVWVLDQLRNLLHNATEDASLDSQLRQEKTVFFLHLLGLDTTGHSYRPHSKEYMNNIQVVDSIVRQTEALFSEFYGDEKTTFVFTADHGMSQIGNHGDGDPDNTRTPLIAWGAGVRGPLPDSRPSSHDEYSASWGLSHLLRHDVEQADVAALMSAILGTDWPANSVGVLPDVDHARPGYLLSTVDNEKRQAQAALVNARVLLEHYRVKHELKKSHALFYKPFHYFTHFQRSEYPAQELVDEIHIWLRSGQYNGVRRASAELIEQTLEGLRYLETYDRTLIRSIVLAAYTGWIAFSATHVLPRGQMRSLGNVFVLNVISALVLLSSWLVFTVQHSSWSLYLYVCFPVYFWREAIARCGGSVTTIIGAQTFSGALKRLVQAALVVAALQSMVVAYTHRSIWSAGFVVSGVMWPLLFWPRQMWGQQRGTALAWVAASLATAVFPLLPVDKQENITVIMLGGLCMVVVGIYGWLGGFGTAINPKVSKRMMLQIALLLLSMVITASSAQNLRAKLGLPVINQVAGWVVLVAASVVPFVPGWSQLGAKIRIFTFFLGFAVCFVILSISVEGLFYVAYSATLLVWTDVEAALGMYRGVQAGGEWRLRGEDVRIAVFFLFFVQVAFFGTGNVASISSFYLEPVYRLVPIFSPFLMAALLIFKIVAPYVMLSVFFALLNRRLHLPPFSLFLVALTLTDVMTMTFFFNVTDTGSWLEIGQTISFFCISSLLLVWSAGICALGEMLIAGTHVRTKEPRFAR